jgi:hypothetical protein
MAPFGYTVGEIDGRRRSHYGRMFRRRRGIMGIARCSLQHLIRRTSLQCAPDVTPSLPSIHPELLSTGLVFGFHPLL